MKTQTLGKSALVSTRLAYGCWRVLGTWEPKEVTEERWKAAKAAIVAAFEAGYRLFDHADIYCVGECERVFGEVLREVRGMRERILIASKCGIRFAGEGKPNAPYRYDFSGSYIVQSCEESLKRLGVEAIDVYQLHRPDFLMNPEEVAAAFYQLKVQGKVREFGVSNFGPTQLLALQKSLPFPLVVNQVQIHLGDMHCFEDGTLDQCLMERITPMAWSPLGGGLLGDRKIDEKQPRREAMLKLREVLDGIAGEYGARRSVIALAWLLKHPARIIPIIGSGSPERIAEAAGADEIDLSREEWYSILEAARGERLA